MVIHTIAFQDNSVTWLNVAINIGQNVVVKKVLQSPLPFVLNLDNIRKPTAALQVANHLTTLAASNELEMDEVRFLLPGRFGLVKKVMVDSDIPEAAYSELARAEAGSVFAERSEQYLVYEPSYQRENQSLKELLTVSVHRRFFDFVRKVGDEARFNLTHVGLNCFTIDELFRRFFPSLSGHTLLVNFTERGYELVIADSDNFIDFVFRPYSGALHSMEQLKEETILNTFGGVINELQKPAFAEMPLYAFRQAFLFGTHFKAQWLERLQGQTDVQLRVLNPTDTTEWQIISDDSSFNTMEAYRYIEPLSHIF